MLLDTALWVAYILKNMVEGHDMNLSLSGPTLREKELTLNGNSSFKHSQVLTSPWSYCQDMPFLTSGKQTASSPSIPRGVPLVNVWYLTQDSGARRWANDVAAAG